MLMLGTGFEKLGPRKYPSMDLVTSLLYSRAMDPVGRKLEFWILKLGGAFFTS